MTLECKDRLFLVGPMGSGKSSTCYRRIQKTSKSATCHAESFDVKRNPGKSDNLY